MLVQDRMMNNHTSISCTTISLIILIFLYKILIYQMGWLKISTKNAKNTKEKFNRLEASIYFWLELDKMVILLLMNLDLHYHLLQESKLQLKIPFQLIPSFSKILIKFQDKHLQWELKLLWMPKKLSLWQVGSVSLLLLENVQKVR